MPAHTGGLNSDDTERIYLMADKLRIGLVGCGGIAKGKHLPSLSRLNDVELVAFCDIVPERAAECAKEYGSADAKTYTDYKKLLADKTIDVVHVLTPNDSHAEITVASLESGKHTLSEKPMAKKAKDARKMVEAAKKSGKKLTIGYQSRHRNDSQYLKKLVEKGELGEIYYAKAHAIRRRGVPTWGVFMDKEKQGGGPLIDIGVHILDLTLWLMGHPKPIAASGVTYQHLGVRGDLVGFMGQWDYKKFTVEDMASALIRFDNGATIMLESSFIANWKDEVNNSTIVGTEGGCQTHPTTITQERYGSMFSYELKVPNNNINTHHAEMAAFVECIRDKKEPLVTGEHGLMVAKIMDAIYKSADAGKEVAID